MLVNHEILQYPLTKTYKVKNGTPPIMTRRRIGHWKKNRYSEICDALRDLVPFLQFKNVKNIHGGVLLLVHLLANFTKSTFPP